MTHLGFDFEDAFHLEAGFGLDRVQALLGHAAEAAVGFCGGDFHIQPALKLRLLTPDGTHYGQGVTLDHRRARLEQPLNSMNPLVPISTSGAGD